jgi:hypothetical protein
MPHEPAAEGIKPDTEDLKRRLLRRYGKADHQELVGLAAAVGLIAQGRLGLDVVEEAIDAGWDPGSQHVLAFLAQVPISAPPLRPAA